MAQFNVKLEEKELEALRRYAFRRRTPMSWLVKDYIAYLLAGGEPVYASLPEAPSAKELATLAQRGGAFDWLDEEPEIYSLADGEPV